MKKKSYITPKIREAALNSATLMEDGFSEDPTQAPEVDDTELDANRAWFDEGQTDAPRQSVWE